MAESATCTRDEHPVADPSVRSCEPSIDGDTGAHQRCCPCEVDPGGDGRDVFGGGEEVLLGGARVEEA